MQTISVHKYKYRKRAREGSFGFGCGFLSILVGFHLRMAFFDVNLKVPFNFFFTMRANLRAGASFFFGNVSPVWSFGEWVMWGEYSYLLGKLRRHLVSPCGWVCDSDDYYSILFIFLQCFRMIKCFYKSKKPSAKG